MGWLGLCGPMRLAAMHIGGAQELTGAVRIRLDVRVHRSR